MELHFLLNDVSLEVSHDIPPIDPVVFSKPYLRANDRQFYLNVINVGEFYSENGNSILINPLPGVTAKTIELYLNGSILGSILHQRQILALHGSSFKFKNKVVIICGDSGFGKSSITLSFCKKHGAKFLTDDITPIQNGLILPISERMKIWNDMLDSLNIEKKKLSRIHEEMDKYYLEQNSIKTEVKPSVIFFGEIHAKADIDITEVKGAQKFEKVFNNQYWEELTTSTIAARETYFSNIMNICDSTQFFVLKRPEKIRAKNLSAQLADFISELK